AYIDFPDEPVPDSVVQDISGILTGLQTELRRHLNDNQAGERLRRGFYAVILGAPNAGKSSLLNHLARRDVAIVSDQAGTTRDFIEVHLDIGGIPVTLVDTAGLREQAGSIESEGNKRALA